MKHHILFGLLIVIVSVGFSTGHAATITTFDNRIVWEAASVLPGSPLVTVDFNNFVLDQSFGVGTLGVDLGPFSLRAIGGIVTPTLNIIDASPFVQFGGGVGSLNIDNSTYALMSVDFGNLRVVMAFDKPVLAWGADFNVAPNPEKVDLQLFFTTGDPSKTVPVPINAGLGFFGFVSDTPISVIHFTSRFDFVEVGQDFGLDNVSMRVPEGSTLTFSLLGGVLALLSMAWRRFFRA